MQTIGFSNNESIAFRVSGFMLDCMGLSLKNGWLDGQNRVYIYFTLGYLQDFMNCGHKKGIKLMAELDKTGLIERVKQGLSSPVIIYVKRFSTNCFYPTPTKPTQQRSLLNHYLENYVLLSWF